MPDPPGPALQLKARLREGIRAGRPQRALPPADPPTDPSEIGGGREGAEEACAQVAGDKAHLSLGSGVEVDVDLVGTGLGALLAHLGEVEGGCVAPAKADAQRVAPPLSVAPDQDIGGPGKRRTFDQAEDVVGVVAARRSLPHMPARRRPLKPAPHSRSDRLAAKIDDAGGHERRDTGLGWRDSAEQGWIPDLFSRNVAGPQACGAVARPPRRASA